MIPELDIYRSAQILVKQHGEDASVEIAVRTVATNCKSVLVMYIAGAYPYSRLRG